MASTRIVQILHEEFGRRVGLVHDDELHLLSMYRSAYALATAAIQQNVGMRELISEDLSGIVLDYNQVHSLKSDWKFLPSFDHPERLSACQVSGVGNAHTGNPEGRPAAPSWFYKGNGAHLRSHGEPLDIPPYAFGGAEEIEIAGVWVMDARCRPVLIGLTPGNEFCDPAMEESNTRLRSHGKLRNCSIGPELVLDGEFRDIHGAVRIERDGKRLWSREVSTGEQLTQFSLKDLEQFVFRYDAFRVPGDAHILYLGASVCSYTEGVRLQDGDEVVIEWDGFGRPMRNVISRPSRP